MTMRITYAGRVRVEAGIGGVALLRKGAWILIPLGVFAVLRLVSFVMLSVALKEQVELQKNDGFDQPFVYESVPAAPGLGQGLMNWDGQWYRSIAESGYPGDLPRVDGEVQMNSWAFYPVYPLMVRAFMALTGGSFAIVGPALSLATSLIATVILFWMVRNTSDTYVASTLIIGLHAFPTSPSFQLAYTEGLALLIIVAALWALRHRRLALFSLLAVLLSLTRPIALALAAAVAILTIFDPQLRDEVKTRRAGFAGSATILVGSVVIWPAVAWLSTGEPKAFTLTQAAWPGNDSDLGLWGNWIFAPIYYGEFGLFLVGMTLLAACLIPAIRPASRLWGPELRAWAVAYPVFVLLSTRPTLSLFRYVLLTIAPFWPLPELWHPSAPKIQKAARITVPLLLVLTCLYLQWRWLANIYVVTREPQFHP